MPRHMSFFLTQGQMRDRTKSVTRRTGWKSLQKGDYLWAVEKAQGLKKGQEVKKIALIEVTAVRQEPLNRITKEEVDREGFPKLTPYGFCQMFAKANKMTDWSEKVTRICFRICKGRYTELSNKALNKLIEDAKAMNQPLR